MNRGAVAAIYEGVDYLLGDTSKAKAAFGWEPKVRVQELVQIMMDTDASTSSAQVLRQAQHKYFDKLSTGLELLGVTPPGQGLRALQHRWESQVVSMETA